MAAEHSCSACGREVSDHDRHIRFALPDPVLHTAEQHHAPGSWLSHDTPNTSVMMQIQGIGAFVRALLPVSPSGGHRLTFGVWVAINPAEFLETFSTWWTPEYADLHLQGYLANAVGPWGLLGAPVVLEVKDIDHTPYCVDSEQLDLAEVLHKEWPHEILDGLPA